MTLMTEDVLKRAEAHIVQFFRERISEDHVFHDLDHTRQAVAAVDELGPAMGMGEQELLLLRVAAWFHDSGYDSGTDQHEIRSADYAASFMEECGFPKEDIELVRRCILATNMSTVPEGDHEKLLRDADLSHLGKAIYWERCSRLRQELALMRQVIMPEREWVDSELDFMQRHQYMTKAAEELYGERKAKHVRQLRKHKRRVERGATPVDLPKAKRKKRKQPPEAYGIQDLDFNLGRGVETMYRTTYRTHVNLSAIADNKSNIMLSMSAIVLSIALPQLLPRFGEESRLVIPSLLLMITCIAAIVLATLATRPKITQGRFTREDIQTRKANLLFFGNFYRMKLDDFHWGMMEMIKDKDFLYSSMTRDIYYLGVVLASKFRFLSYCYTVFMWGMLATVFAFAVAFLLF